MLKWVRLPKVRVKNPLLGSSKSLTESDQDRGEEENREKERIVHFANDTKKKKERSQSLGDLAGSVKEVWSEIPFQSIGDEIQISRQTLQCNSSEMDVVLVRHSRLAEKQFPEVENKSR